MVEGAVFPMELKIPPPLVLAMLAAVMWMVAGLGGSPLPDPQLRAPLSLTLFVLGVAVELAAIRQFRKARTTINPLTPMATARLVDAGIYRLSRNPMYLGALLLLAAWAVWLGRPVNLAGLFLFVWYVTKYQIVPEERVLTELFRDEYESYRAKVRRWI